MGNYYFKIDLAGKKIEIRCNYKHVFYECQNYLSDFDMPDYCIESSLDEIEAEVSKVFGNIAQTYIKENIAVEYVDIESNIILQKIANVFVDLGILLIHGAAIAVNGKCFVFIADSGVGKTTHILNWLKVIPGTTIVNGDKPFVDVNKGIVYGTPWCGKERFQTNMSSPIGGIISLVRGKTNCITKIAFKEMLPVLFQQTFIPPSILPVEGYQLLALLKDVPCYRLACNMNEESAIIAFNGLSKEYG